MSDDSDLDSNDPGRLRPKKNYEMGQVKQSFSNRRTRTVQVERKISKSSSRGASSSVGSSVEHEGGYNAEDNISSEERAKRERLIARAGERKKEELVNNDTGTDSAAFGIKRSANFSDAHSISNKRERFVTGVSVSSSSPDKPDLRGRDGQTQRQETKELRRGYRGDHPRERQNELAKDAGVPKGDRRAGRVDRESHKNDQKSPPVTSPSQARLRNDRVSRSGGFPRSTTTSGLSSNNRSGKSGSFRGSALRETSKRAASGKNTLNKTKSSVEKRKGKLTIRDALDEVDREIERRRGRSLAALKRARERQREQIMERLKSGEKVRREVVVRENITVAELANRMAERVSDVMRLLANLDITATETELIDADSAELIINEFGHKIKRVSFSDIEIKLEEADKKSDAHKVSRPPIVTVMGHVDHGKTSLLDVIRKSSVVKSEAGGITQHIGASRVLLPSGRGITFIDTPGHEAFSLMRARGAMATDIVILVVAADDGVKEQTVEAINHAKAAEVPIVVALSKCDLPNARVDVVLDALASRGLLVESRQGEVLCVNVSSHSGEGIEKLLEAILLQSDLLELKAVTDGVCRGVVLESRTDKGHGILASLLVQEGSLRKGDVLLAGAQWGRIRVMLDEHGKVCESASPSHPVQVSGLQGHLHSGEVFRTVSNETRAREVGEHRAQHLKELKQNKSSPSVAVGDEITVEQLLDNAHRDNNVKRFPFVLKADAHGTLEVVTHALKNVSATLDEAEIVILHGDVGSINESDISLAAASGACVLGFSVKPTVQARALAKNLSVDVRFYKVLYELLNEIESLLKRTLAPKTREIRLGLAEIKQVFPIGKIGNIAGSAVLDGVMRRGARARILRGEENDVLHEGRVKFLKSYKEEVREVSKGAECGIAFDNFQDFSANDRIECFLVEDVEETRA